MINFLKYRYLYIIVSLIVIVPGTISLFRHGLKPSIDFKGGTVAEYRYDKLDAQRLKSSLESKFKLDEFVVKNGNNVSVKLPALDLTGIRNLKQIMDTSGDKPTEIHFETLGPTIGKELIKKTLTGLLLATVTILLYVAYAFRDIKFGLAATLATIHDTLIILGVFSLLGHIFGIEVDSLFVTALLTALSFSVHDTIVVFDRIRESHKINKNLSWKDVINRALNETLVRSLNNSLTIIFMLTALFLLGGESIRWFVIALLIGTISGTYSSPFIATPLLFIFENFNRHDAN